MRELDRSSFEWARDTPKVETTIMDHLMLKIDLDFKSKNIDLDDEYDMNAIATDCISKVRTYLDKYMIRGKT